MLGIFTSCYGYEKWLPEWVSAVRELPVDEVVIVGDQAAFDTAQTLDLPDGWKFVLDPEPFHQARAHNDAVGELTTEWIFHLGVDDLPFPNLVSDLRAKFDDADVVAVDVVRERDGKQLSTRRNRPTTEKILKPTMGQQPLDACAAFRRSFWERHRYDESFPTGCDVALWIGFAHLGARFTHTGKPGVRYRLHQDSLWHSRSTKDRIALREKLNDLRRPPVKVSVAVMAHPKRKEYVEQLLADLDRPAEVVWDEKQDIWDTGRRSLLAYDPTATHHLVIQDDAVVCRDLVAGLEKALRTVPPDVPLGLYLGHHPPHSYMVSQLAVSAGHASWIVMPAINWGVAVVIPTKLIPDLVAHGDTLSIPSYDQRIGNWCRKRRIKAWYPWPSLVEHRDIQSLIGRKPGRRARKFVGVEVSALELDYDGGSCDLPLGGRSKGEQPRRQWRHSDGRLRTVAIGTPPDIRYASLDGWEQVETAVV